VRLFVVRVGLRTELLQVLLGSGSYLIILAAPLSKTHIIECTVPRTLHIGSSGKKFSPLRVPNQAWTRIQNTRRGRGSTGDGVLQAAGTHKHASVYPHCALIQ
jgi:hypothetical protein